MYVLLCGPFVFHFISPSVFIVLPPSLLTSSQDKSVQLLDVASATDKGVWLQLATPTTHCLLVTGLCQCDPKWIPLASARLEQASNSGEAASVHNATYMYIVLL